MLYISNIIHVYPIKHVMQKKNSAMAFSCILSGLKLSVFIVNIQISIRKIPT